MPGIPVSAIGFTRSSAEGFFRRLIEADQLLAFKHEGFWRPMDTLKDKQVLEDLAEHGTIPWQLSEDSSTVLPSITRKVG